MIHGALHPVISPTLELNRKMQQPATRNPKSEDGDQRPVISVHYSFRDISKGFSSVSRHRSS